MPPQLHDWTCSVCSATWVLQSTSTAYLHDDVYEARRLVGEDMGYPNCVNETYGCMSADCLLALFGRYGLLAHHAWVTFDQAYAIAEQTTGLVNPVGMYHFMALRGVLDVPALWLANSAIGYRGVGESLNRNQFNSLGPVQVIYLANPQPS